MQYEARSRFTPSTGRDPSSTRLRRDEVCLRRPNEDGALQKWLSATSTAPHGDVRREIAHNAPPPVFHKKWNSNNVIEADFFIGEVYTRMNRIMFFAVMIFSCAVFAEVPELKLPESVKITYGKQTLYEKMI